MAEAGAADRIGSTLLGLGKGRSRPWGMARVAKVRESFGRELKQTLGGGLVGAADAGFHHRPCR